MFGSVDQLVRTSLPLPMHEVVLMSIGGIIVLLFEWVVLRPLFMRRRFDMYESAILQSVAFLQCERHGVGADAVLKIGNDVFEDWEHLAAFEKLLAEGYVEKIEGHKFGLSAQGVLIGARLFERGARTRYAAVQVELAD